jgi:hypothetical protein
MGTDELDPLNYLELLLGQNVEIIAASNKIDVTTAITKFPTTFIAHGMVTRVVDLLRRVADGRELADTTIRADWIVQALNGVEIQR